MADLSTQNGLTADRLPEEQTLSNQYDLPTVDQILYGIEPTLLSVQEISAKVGIIYDRAMWLLRRYVNSNEESINLKYFAKLFENTTNSITKNLRERKLDKVTDYLNDQIFFIRRLAWQEPEAAKFIFPDGVDEVIQSFEVLVANIGALSLSEA
jgi:hypothetical protein